MWETDRGRMSGMRMVLSAVAALLLATSATAQPATGPAPDAVTVHGDQPAPKFDRRIFGQFAEHLGTGISGRIWVGPGSKIHISAGYRRDVDDALRAIHVPVVRWPGGRFADEYH